MTFAIDSEDKETAIEWVDAHLPAEPDYDIRQVEGEVRDGRWKVRFDKAAT